jgi:hypothetical protein
MEEQQPFSSSMVAVYAGISGMLALLLSTPFLWHFSELPGWMKAVAILIVLLGIWEMSVAYKIWKATL